jgi:3,4-dihydroxy 2-butanone 4-phosphate synthase/GTP cyclohydrolase II
MILLTNAPPTLVALKGFALNVAGHRPMVATSSSSWIC